ncbi:hypothetical protein GCM10009634_49140 [Saccharothrix xinjiangensis]
MNHRVTYRPTSGTAIPARCRMDLASPGRRRPRTADRAVGVGTGTPDADIPIGSLAPVDEQPMSGLPPAGR